MIKHLSGDYETVEYEEKRCIMLYHNTQYEEYPVHWHQEIEIIMPLRKCYRLEIGDREYVIRENEVFFIPPGELHHLLACEGERLILQCDNSLLGAQPMFNSIMRGLKAPVLIDESYGSELQAVAKKTMLEIFSLYFSGSELAEVRIYSLLVRLLIALRTRQLTEKTAQLDCGSDKVEEYNEKFSLVLKYIDSNYMNNISLDTLAGIAGYSKYHFSRIFKQYNTISYLQYINERRIRAAELMLQDPALPVTEVAMQVGFKSLTTFNRCFKEIKHCTPTDFKKLCQKR